MIANGDMYTRADMAEIKALSGCRCERKLSSVPFCQRCFLYALP